jgi:hypothetical protein
MEQQGVEHAQGLPVGLSDQARDSAKACDYASDYANRPVKVRPAHHDAISRGAPGVPAELQQSPQR